MESRVTKKCTGCLIEKPLNDFAKGQYKCKECVNSKNREVTLKNNPERAEKEKLDKLGMRKCKACNEIKELELFPQVTRYKGKKRWAHKCRKCRSNETAEKTGSKKQYTKFRDETERTCKTCRKTYPLNETYFQPRHKEKHAHTFVYECIHCFKEKNKKWKESLSEAEKLRIKKDTKKWRKENEDRLKDYRKKYINENKEKINSKKRNRYANDPLFRLSERIRSRVSQAFKVKSYTKNSQTHVYLGMSYLDVKEYLESLFDEKMTWDNYGDWHIDHIIPLASAENEGELIALAYYKNLQPLWADINQSKSDDYDPEDKRKYLEWYSANVKKL